MPARISSYVKGDRFANFNFTDLLTGRSYITYYAGRGLANDVIAGFTFYSDSIFTEIPVNSKVVVDFDSPVTSTFLVDGDAIIQTTVAKLVKSSPSSGVDVSGAVLRVRDGIETNMGEVLLGDEATTADVNDYKMMDTVKLARTRFKSGDTLRLRISVHVLGTNDSWWLFHDPKNRTDTLPASNDGSQLIANIPFNVNL